MNHQKYLFLAAFAAAFTSWRVARFLSEKWPLGQMMERGWASAVNYLLLINY